MEKEKNSAEGQVEEVESFTGHKIAPGAKRKAREADFYEKADELRRGQVTSELIEEYEKAAKKDSIQDSVEKISIPQQELVQKERNTKPEKRKWWNPTSWFKKVKLTAKAVTMPVIAGAMSAPGGDTAKQADDAFFRGTAKTVEWKIPGDSLSKEKNSELDMKKLEQLGITWVQPLEVGDTTKKVFLIAIKEYNSYDEVKDIIKKAGFDNESIETMDEALLKNETAFRRARYVMSLQEIVNKAGNPSYGTMTWDGGTKSFNGNAREIKVIPGGNKKGARSSNFNSVDDEYTFIVSMRESKPASY